MNGSNSLSAPLIGGFSGKSRLGVVGCSGFGSAGVVGSSGLSLGAGVGASGCAGVGVGTSGFGSSAGCAGFGSSAGCSVLGVSGWAWGDGVVELLVEVLTNTHLPSW